MMEITVPGSKSITNRALIAASLAKGKSVLSNVLYSDDTLHMIRALKQLGVKIKQLKNNKLEIHGGRLKKSPKAIFGGNSGTTMRFLTAVLAAQNFESVLYGNSRMQSRPIADLLDALNQLGANVNPIKGPLIGGHCYIGGKISSQFLSGLLLAAPLAQNSVTIHVQGNLVSRPYVDMTLDIISQFGIEVKRNGYKKFFIQSGQKYCAQNFEIEGDASSATYFWGISALIDEEIKIKNIPDNSKQPDIAIKTLSSNLTPLKINCRDFPDGAMTLAVFCAFNKGKFVLTGLENLRVKECDRLYALSTELKKIGCRCRSTKDSLIISGNPESLHGAKIKTYDDHRIAMCFGMAQFVLPEIKIMHPSCVKKTYPNFWKDLAEFKKYFQQKNIILTGMRGSGKTKLGRLLGRYLGRKFIDIDALIEQKANKTISEIVSKNGWPHFRHLEHEVVKKISKLKSTIIATGGGTLCFKENAKLLKQNGKVIFLDSKISSLKQRLFGKTDRPSLKVAPFGRINCLASLRLGITGKKDFLKELNEIYLKRLATYNNVADAILDVSQQTNNKQRDLEKKMQKLLLICGRFGVI